MNENWWRWFAVLWLSEDIYVFLNGFLVCWVVRILAIACLDADIEGAILFF